jgi:hypothetical protein
VKTPPEVRLDRPPPEALALLLELSVVEINPPGALVILRPHEISS